MRSAKVMNGFVSPPFWLILPSFALAILVIAYPIIELAVVGTHQVSSFGQLRGFNGLGNFRHVLDQPLFWESLVRTAWWTLGVVGGTVAISIPVALMLNERFIGRGLARAFILLPWSVSLPITAVVWRWAFNGESGLINLTLSELGLSRHPVQWLASASTAFPIEIAVGILVSIPFTVVVLLGGLSSIPADIYEAATMEGASPAKQLLTLTLPLMRPYINIVFVLNVIYVFNSFPVIWVLTQGGPANSTDILVTYLYKLAFRFGELGNSAAISMMMFVILFMFSLIYLHLVQRSDRNA